MASAKCRFSGQPLQKTWNLKEEIMELLALIGKYSGQFVVPIPEVKILPQNHKKLDLKAA